jgi:hypothetical protein
VARSPLIIDTPIGRLYCIDLGGGAAMLMIESDGQAQTFPIDADEGKRLAQYLRPLGKPAGTTNASTKEALQELVNIYTSEEAAASSMSKAVYTAAHLGIPEGTVYTRLKRAKTLGMIPEDA